METNELVRKAMGRGQLQASVPPMMIFATLLLKDAPIGPWWAHWLIGVGPFLLLYLLQEWYFRRHPLQ